MKKFIKSLLGRIKCFRFSIAKYGRRIYIGHNSKIVNGKFLKIDDVVSIMPYNMIVVHKNGKIVLESGCEIGMFSRVTAKNLVQIGKNVITGPNVFIADYNHEYRNIDIAIKSQGSNYKQKSNEINKVIIKEDCWIGTNVVIVVNVTIGRHCVIGANSVVNSNIPDYCVAVGNPAKVVKKYNFDKGEWEKTS